MTSRFSLTRALALPTAAVLAVGLLGGCAGGGDASPLDDVQAGQEAPASPDADESPASSATDESPASGLRVSEDGLEVSYDGVAGMTALDLLLQLDPTATTSGEGENAFVTAIAGRAADPAENEFWGFYVNGEMAPVGAGSYVMEDGDVITWKLETF